MYMREPERGFGTDTLIEAGVHLLTPPFRMFYALLFRAGVLVIDE